MTDRIDLDDLEADGEDEGNDANPGDWFWRGEGSPDDEPEPDRIAGAGPAADGTDAATSDDESRNQSVGDRNAAASPTDSTAHAAPHVPRSNAGKPAGIPTEYGGAGGGETTEARGQRAEPRPAGSAAEGPHGGGVDDMTLAFTYGALRQVANPAAVFADASSWADWLGIVGDVDTHQITKFQRTHGVDADFFTGSGTSPAERLREIDRTSMFYAERMVVVGVDEADETIADRADWEYVSLETAAEKADWELRASQ